MADVDEVGNQSPHPQVPRGHFFVEFLLVRFFKGFLAVHAYFNCSVISAKQRTCPTGEVWCGDWKCILRRKVCDGTQDCSNGQDEKDCGM